MIQPSANSFIEFWLWIGDNSKQFSALGSVLNPLAILSGSVLIQWLIAKQNREAAKNRYLQELVFNYIDRMTTLIIDKGLNEEMNKDSDDLGDTWAVARSLTMAIFQERDLGSERVRLLTSFLGSTGLIGVVGAGSKSLLINADLRNTNLMHAQFDMAFLNLVKLTDSDLSFADFTGARLYGADLCRANLSHAELLLARLQNANLENAILKNAKLKKADLRGSNLSGATLKGTDFQDALYNTQPINNSTSQPTFFPNGFDPEEKGMKLLNDNSYPYSLS